MVYFTFALLHHNSLAVSDLQDELMNLGNILEDVSGCRRVLYQQLHPSVRELLPGLHERTYLEDLFDCSGVAVLLYLHLLRGYKYYIRHGEIRRGSPPIKSSAQPRK